MARIKDLIDKVTRQVFYPRTHTRAVIDDEGRDLETRLATERTATAETAELAALKAQAKLIGAGYSESTGLFSFNGLTDITADEMRLIILETGDGTALYKAKFAWSEIRTMRAAAAIRQGIVDADQSYAFFRCQRLEVAAIGTEQARSFVPAGVAGMFSGCAKLREVRGLLCLIGGTGFGIFKGCAALEEIRCITRGNCDFSDCPRLSLASLRHMVDNHEPVVTSMVTITVHADVYAKLTDPGNAEWHAVLTAATARNISFAKP